MLTGIENVLIMSTMSKLEAHKFSKLRFYVEPDLNKFM